MTDPFAALEALAGRWQDVGDAEGATANDDHTITLWVNAGNQLRAAIAEARAQMGEHCVGAMPPYSVTHIDGDYLGIGGGHTWHVMGTLDGNPRNPQGPVAVCEWEPSAHAIAALLNAAVVE